MNRFSKNFLKFLAVSLLLSLPSLAADRVLQIVAPKTAKAESTVHATVMASSKGAGAEQIGFLQVEYSVDGGENWTVVCYDENVGAQASRTFDMKVGEAGGEAVVRARVAFRGGAAGDVGFDGNIIKWDTTWDTWGTPPARRSVIAVK